MTAATTRQQLDATRPSGDPAAPLDAAVRERVDDTVEHFNANHADTVLLLARHAAGAVDAVDAEVVAVDTQGIGFAVVTTAGRARVRAAPERSMIDVVDRPPRYGSRTTRPPCRRTVAASGSGSAP